MNPAVRLDAAAASQHRHPVDVPQRRFQYRLGVMQMLNLVSITRQVTVIRSRYFPNCANNQR